MKASHSSWVLAHVGDVQQAAGAAALVRLALEVLGLLEVRQDALVRPAAIAELAPGVVVERLAADIEHAVDRRRAAERAAARARDAAAGHALLRLHLEVPVELVVVQKLGEAGRDVDPHRLVARARLEQQHLDGRILGQPVGQHAARRAAAHDDVIPIGHLLRSLIRRPERSRGASFVRTKRIPRAALGRRV